MSLLELMLRRPALTLSAAESMTCGHVQAAIGAISGASNFFRGGMTAYTIDEKVRHLGVNRARARAVNCVSAEIAAEMATGACRLFSSDLGVATTGYAEPALAEGVTEPFAWWAIAHRRKGRMEIRSGRIECVESTRVEAQEIVAQAVMAELVEYLREIRA